MAEELLKRYGLNGERYPFAWGFDVSPLMPAGPPAVLWVAVGARMGLTTIVLDDHASEAVVRLDLYGEGIDQVRVTARGDGRLMSAADLRAVPPMVALADLAQLGDVILASLSVLLDNKDSAASLGDMVGEVMTVNGSAENALLHLVGLLQRKRAQGAEGAELRRQVAENYRMAIDGKLGAEAQRAPRKAVARMVFKSEAYVGRLLVEARDMGLLEQTTPGRKNQPSTEGGT